MHFATTKRETTVAELTRRIFRLEGEHAAVRAREAEAELIRVNPHLRDLRHLPEGTVILVPPVAEIKEEAHPTELLVAEVAKQAHLAVADLRTLVAARLADLAEDAKRAVELLKSPDFEKSAKEIAGLAEHLPALEAEARVRVKESEAVQKAHGEVLLQVEKDLDVLAKRFGGGV